jgi:hypothetical protein
VFRLYDFSISEVSFPDTALAYYISQCQGALASNMVTLNAAPSFAQAACRLLTFNVFSKTAVIAATPLKISLWSLLSQPNPFSSLASTASQFGLELAAPGFSEVHQASEVRPVPSAGDGPSRFSRHPAVTVPSKYVTGEKLPWLLENPTVARPGRTRCGYCGGSGHHCGVCPAYTKYRSLPGLPPRLRIPRLEILPVGALWKNHDGELFKQGVADTLLKTVLSKRGTGGAGSSF